MDKHLSRLRIIHVAFAVTWFQFIFITQFLVHPAEPSTAPTLLPIVLGIVSICEIGVAFYLRRQFIDEPASILIREPENQAALNKWRAGNLLSFCFAETITLFGFAQKLLGIHWNTAGIFFGVGLMLLFLWAPRKIEALPRGVR